MSGFNPNRDNLTAAVCVSKSNRLSVIVFTTALVQGSPVSCEVCQIILSSDAKGGGRRIPPPH